MPKSIKLAHGIFGRGFTLLNLGEFRMSDNERDANLPEAADILRAVHARAEKANDNELRSIAHAIELIAAGFHDRRHVFYHTTLPVGRAGVPVDQDQITHTRAHLANLIGQA